MKQPTPELKVPANVIRKESSPGQGHQSGIPRRFLFFLGYVVILVAVFAAPLKTWASYASGSDVHSYVLLIPLVSAYLIYIRWSQLPREYQSSLGLAMIPIMVGATALVASWRFQEQVGENDYSTLIATSFVCFVIAGAYLILGRHWMRAAAFPLGFLIFMIPLPSGVVDFLEIASQNASAEVANVLFIITGTPTLRDGNLFQLPGITIRVAQECSGIRSSLVLVITSLLASYLFLRTPARRAVLVASVIPLGLLRNGFRILVVALLCVHIGPEMINSPIHRRGGPVFFAASLVPLFIILWALYRSEERIQAKERAAAGNAATDEVQAGQEMR
jgi:exosortase C (VPDSG-CTERM-specific)